MSGRRARVAPNIFSARNIHARPRETCGLPLVSPKVPTQFAERVTLPTLTHGAAPHLACKISTRTRIRVRYRSPAFDKAKAMPEAQGLESLKNRDAAAGARRRKSPTVAANSERMDEVSAFSDEEYGVARLKIRRVKISFLNCHRDTEVNFKFEIINLKFSGLRRTALVPVGFGLVSDGKLKQLTLTPGGADELDAGGEAVLTEAVRHGDRRHADEVARADG
ncbi:MAG: hypothetical protein QOH49_2267 [Acidobacteriota bacterium]|nr:hypothetical protein [Acidobacteriota bacterium]